MKKWLELGLFCAFIGVLLAMFIGAGFDVLARIREYQTARLFIWGNLAFILLVAGRGIYLIWRSDV